MAASKTAKHGTQVLASPGTDFRSSRNLENTAAIDEFKHRK
jgi:hypothetical protein